MKQVLCCHQKQRWRINLERKERREEGMNGGRKKGKKEERRRERDTINIPQEQIEVG